ncbi:MAG: hypothetical protein HOO67_05695 [Candidatus Peribacteraceae bacterium]|nr:hypothetical protein [Candidatus Peribacteraceae bacterium]
MKYRLEQFEDRNREPVLSAMEARERKLRRGDLLSRVIQSKNPDADAVLDAVIQNPAEAGKIAEQDPLFASFLILHGTKRVHTLMPPPKPKGLGRFFAILSTPIGDPVAAAKTARGVYALRSAFAKYLENVRGTTSAPLVDEQQRNEQKQRLVTDVTTTSGQASKLKEKLSPAALRQMQYIALGIMGIPEHARTDYLREHFLPGVEFTHNAYGRYPLTNERLQEAADTYEVLHSTNLRWIGVRDNKAVIDPRKDADLLQLDPVSERLRMSATNIRDRDANHTPVMQLVDPELDKKL